MLVVKIQNKIINEIISVVIDYDIRKCYNILTLTIPYEIEDKDLYKPFSYQSITVSFNDKILFTGIIEIIATNLSTNKVVLNAKNKTAILTRTSFMKKYVYKNLTISKITKEICSHFDISVNAPNGDSKSFDVLEFDINKNIYPQLVDVARLSNIKNYHPLISTNFDGSLSIGKNVSNNKTVMTYHEDDMTMIDGKVVFDGSIRHNKYYRYGQNLDNVDISTNISDSIIKIKSEDSQICFGRSIEQCQNIAGSHRAFDISMSNDINIAVKTWLDKNDDLLEVGKNVSLKSPNCMIFELETFMIEKIKYSYDTHGETAILKLTPRDTYKL